MWQDDKIKRLWSACIWLCTLSSHLFFMHTPTQLIALTIKMSNAYKRGRGSGYILGWVLNTYQITYVICIVSRDDAPSVNTALHWNCMCYCHIAASGTISLAFLNYSLYILSNAVLVNYLVDLRYTEDNLSIFVLVLQNSYKCLWTSWK